MRHTECSLAHRTATVVSGSYWRSLWSHGNRALLVGSVLVGLCACTSPETMRTRGGGPGADVGNRDAVVEFHAGAHPYYRTPCRMSVDCPDMRR
jgi:hypothetical protein